jgi:Polyketide cyclase / dehydrase and lipid transport
VLRFLGWLSVVIVLAIGTAAVMGSRLPVEHTASVSEIVSASQQKVWGLTTDPAAMPKWRTELKGVTLLAPEGNAPCWAEIQSSMTMALCADVREEPTRQVVRIADPKLPFGGTWTYELEPAGADSTKVTITEHGTTGPAMWRFVRHYVMGEDGSIKQYLSDLKRAAAQPS